MNNQQISENFLGQISLNILIYYLIQYSVQKWQAKLPSESIHQAGLDLQPDSWNKSTNIWKTGGGERGLSVIL